MNTIWYRKSFVVGGYWPLWLGWKNEWPRRTDKSRTLKNHQVSAKVCICVWGQPNNQRKLTRPTWWPHDHLTCRRIDFIELFYYFTGVLNRFAIWQPNHRELDLLRRHKKRRKVEDCSTIGLNLFNKLFKSLQTEFRSLKSYGSTYFFSIRLCSFLWIPLACMMRFTGTQSWLNCQHLMFSTGFKLDDSTPPSY